LRNEVGGTYCDPFLRRAGGHRDNGAKPSMDIELTTRLDRIEGILATLVERQVVKDWYSTEESARIVGKAEFTVRERCRLGRIKAEERRSGRGAHAAWVVSHQELLRFQRDGLLPVARANAGRS
jgi:hypothetical protein